MSSQEQELFGELAMCNLYIVFKGSYCYTLIR